MCLKFESYFTGVDKLIASSGLPFDVVDETEHLSHGLSQLHTQLHSACRNSRVQIMSKHDVCEDG